MLANRYRSHCYRFRRDPTQQKHVSTLHLPITTAHAEHYVGTSDKSDAYGDDSWVQHAEYKIFWQDSNEHAHELWGSGHFLHLGPCYVVFCSWNSHAQHEGYVYRLCRRTPIQSVNCLERRTAVLKNLRLTGAGHVLER